MSASSPKAKSNSTSTEGPSCELLERFVRDFRHLHLPSTMAFKNWA